MLWSSSSHDVCQLSLVISASLGFPVFQMGPFLSLQYILAESNYYTKKKPQKQKTNPGNAQSQLTYCLCWISKFFAITEQRSLLKCSQWCAFWDWCFRSFWRNWIHLWFGARWAQQVYSLSPASWILSKLISIVPIPTKQWSQGSQWWHFLGQFSLLFHFSLCLWHPYILSQLSWSPTLTFLSWGCFAYWANCGTFTLIIEFKSKRGGVVLVHNFLLWPQLP